ncbi:acyltransferase [Anaerocolumna sp. AGMB13020]|uniref:acyltransferase n=1 Tax=Anaerocolumna sp. AGMB13020 TaxID=3081750 RepID=UPI002952B37D|nr:acyltransferase [Anaerocolumna sp. AGMB13020]WOO36078.1 acyltransferase [Anaerocolumna sp. AGMB13020]
MQAKDVNNTFYVLRFFAILAVVMAHSVYTLIPNDTVVKVFNSFGRCGVIIFFIISGYYFRKEKYENVLQLLKAKLKTIIIPWIIWGMAIYCTRFTSTDLYFSLKEIILWLLGFGTYLYFLTIYILLLCIFQILPQKSGIQVILLLCTLINVYLVAGNVGPYSVLKSTNVHAELIYLLTYLNIFNWIGFFTLGLLLRKINLFENKKLWAFKYKIIINIFIISLLVCMILIEKGNTYWTNYSIWIEMSFFVILFQVSKLLKDVKYIQEIGKVTMPIYLIHFLIEGFIFNKVLPESIIMGLIRPLISVLVVYWLLQLGLIISKKIHLQRLYTTFLGLKS